MITYLTWPDRIFHMEKSGLATRDYMITVLFVKQFCTSDYFIDIMNDDQ